MGRSDFLRNIRQRRRDDTRLLGGGLEESARRCPDKKDTRKRLHGNEDIFEKLSRAVTDDDGASVHEPRERALRRKRVGEGAPHIKT